MKILKFSGIVVGIHLLALILIFANPGCSSSTKQPPAKSETMTPAETPPTISVPGATSSTPAATAPISFNTDVRYSPTRPGTPAASTLETEPVNNFTPATTYIVVSGDNLTVIARKNHLTVSELAAANNLNVNTAKLRPGQKLIVPGKSPALAKAGDAARLTATSTITEPAGAKPATDLVKHTVKSGETLSSIAQKYGVKIGDLGAENNINDPKKIRPGMELLIPGWQATGGKSVRTQKSGSEVNAKPEAAMRSTPASTPVIDPSFSRPTPANEVPIIQVEEAPATTK
ncbi:MAG: LysM peptidoglycan-binding domain-containing protein [Opitutaceae bacterium]